MRNVIRLVLYQPEMPQNAGALMRLGACLGVGVDLIEPLGFVLDDRRLRRAVLDYGEHLELTRHSSFEAFLKAGPGRLIALTTRGERPHTDFAFRPGDRLMVGREGAGLPETVHRAAAARLAIPMVPGARSLNVATAAALVLGEALRQTDGFFEPGSGP